MTGEWLIDRGRWQAWSRAAVEELRPGSPGRAVRVLEQLGKTFTLSETRVALAAG